MLTEQNLYRFHMNWNIGLQDSLPGKYLFVSDHYKYEYFTRPPTEWGDQEQLSNSINQHLLSELIFTGILKFDLI